MPDCRLFLMRPSSMINETHIRQLTELPVKKAGLGSPNPTTTADDNRITSFLSTSEMVGFKTKLPEKK